MKLNLAKIARLYELLDAGTPYSAIGRELDIRTPTVWYWAQKRIDGKPHMAGAILMPSEHPLYSIWSGMKARCYNANNSQYCRYGARGIKVCERWLSSFTSFVADMGERPAGVSIERKNNDGPYAPSNCVWATPKQQSANTRRARLIEFNGDNAPISEWARRAGISSNAMSERLKRWPLSEAFALPADLHRKRHRSA